MIVISDNSALSALAEAGLLGLLPRLFGVLNEKRGRRVAETLGLPKTGVIGIIGEAARLGWLDFDETAELIQDCGFHVSDVIIEADKQQL